jgi:phage terminase large subunit
MAEVLIAEMEDDKKNRPSLYKHKWLGEPSSVEGRIFRDWLMVEQIPHEARRVGRGLDFGYSVDPAAVVDVYEYNGGYILDEVVYRKGMTNSEMANVLKEGDILTVADSAEPKSIDELKSYGITIVPAEKGKDSVLHGIQLIQAQKISVTAHSQNLWREYNTYMWDRDKDGVWLSRPENGADHALDASRYFLQRHLKKDANDTKEFYEGLALRAKMRVKFAKPRAGLR